MDIAQEPEPEEAQEEQEPVEESYWIRLPKEEIGLEMCERIREYYADLREDGLIDLYRSTHAAFYGLSPSGTHETSRIIEFGQDGEKLGVRSNQLRSLIRYILTSATADKPALLPKAINATAKAMAQVPTARRVLEYYHSRKHLQKKLKGAALRSLLYGKGYVVQFWDPTIGKMVDHTDPKTGVVTKSAEGDLIARAGSPLDVISDLDRDEDDHDWYIIRRPRNKYDVAAVFAPGDEELHQEIVDLDGDCLDAGVSQQISFGLRRKEREGSDVIFEYHLLHRETPAVPGGRYVIMVGDGKVLFDGPLPYDDLTVSEMIPEEFLEVGSTGYASAWDLLGLQQGYDALLSTCLTNFDAFGYNDILLPDGVELGYEEVRDGLNVIRYPAGEFNKPSILEKFSIKEEAFQLRDWVKGDMETASGVNSVARGEPEASLKSGAALALVQAQAIHFQSAFVESFMGLVEDAGTKTLRIVKKYATAERVAAIAGSNDPDGLKAFKGADIDLIDHVEVEHVNALFRTLAGKFDVANNMMERGLITDPAQYFQVLETGRLEPVTDPLRQENLFAETVREVLMGGPAVTPKMDPQTGMPAVDDMGMPVMDVKGLPVTIMDHPVLCLRAAKSVLDSMENRSNQAVVLACTTYAMNVLRTWRMAPKDLLSLLGYPLPPLLPGDPMMAPEGEGQNPAPSKGGPNPPNGKGEQEVTESPDEGSGMPSLPKPAEDPLKDAR